MSETFNCPNCGAPLDYGGSDPIIRCPYCNTSVVVPENLRAQPSFSSKPDNFTLNGVGDMAGLLQKARRIKEVRDLARAGNKIEAIKIYREITGGSLEDGKAAVEALSQGQPIMLSGLTGTSSVRIQQQPAPQAQEYTGPAASIETSGAGSGMGRIGCFVGCAVLGFALLIGGLISIPLLASAAFGGTQNMPPALQTVMPSISSVIPAGVATQELSFGGKGTGPGLFTDPRAIAVDSNSGDIFVADFEGGRIQAFDANGKYITQWKVGNKDTVITGLAADHKGNVFVTASTTLYRYSISGKLLDQFEATDAEGYSFENVAAAADGTLYVVGGGDNLIHMDTQGNVLFTVEKAVSNASGDNELDSHVAVDGAGNVYLLGTFNNGVFKFNSQGKYLNTFGGEGDEPGQFRAPSTLAVDGQGNVYVSDFKGIQIFDGNGRYINVFTFDGACFGMAFDDKGNLYITTNQNQVIKYAINLPKSQ